MSENGYRFWEPEGVGREDAKDLAEMFDRVVLGAVREEVPAFVFATIAEACDAASRTAARIFANIEAGFGSAEDARRDFAELRDGLARIEAARVLVGARMDPKSMDAAANHPKSILSDAVDAMEAKHGGSHA